MACFKGPAWVETSDENLVGRRCERRLFCEACYIRGQLRFVEPDNFKITQNLGRYGRLARNILLKLTKNQALSGIVRSDKNGDALRGNYNRPLYLGKFQRN